MRGFYREIKVLTFDCYGTLIDWETGILEACTRLFRAHGVSITPEEILERYARYEAQAESGPYRPYREVLRDVVRKFARAYGLRLRPDDEQCLEMSLKDWLPFPDTVPALQRLKKRYSLAVLSNIDDDLFAFSARHLRIPFDHVITAQQIHVYKPDLRFFRQARDRIGVEPHRILHVAQSLYHDIKPARTLGLRTAWVRRSHKRRGHGATPEATAQPDLVVNHLLELADRLIGHRTG